MKFYSKQSKDRERERENADAMQIATDSMSTPKPRTWASLLKHAEDKNKGSATVDATPPLNKTANDAADGSRRHPLRPRLLAPQCHYSQALLGKSVAERKDGAKGAEKPSPRRLVLPDLGMEDSKDGLNLAFKNTISIKTTSSQSSPTKAKEAGSSSSPHAKSPKQEIEPLTAEKLHGDRSRLILERRQKVTKNTEPSFPWKCAPFSVVLRHRTSMQKLARETGWATRHGDASCTSMIVFKSPRKPSKR